MTAVPETVPDPEEETDQFEDRFRQVMSELLGDPPPMISEQLLFAVPDHPTFVVVICPGWAGRHTGLGVSTLVVTDPEGHLSPEEHADEQADCVS
jgi:hypothetical protein